MTRSLACLTTLAAAAALAPAAASAQRPRPERFVAFFKATQTTKMEKPRVGSDRCDYGWSWGHGSERTTIRTTPMRVTAVRVGDTVSIAYGPLRRPANALKGKGKLSREYFHKRTYNDPCLSGNPTPKPEVTDNRCQDTPRFDVLLVSLGPLLTPIVTPQDLDSGAMLGCSGVGAAEDAHSIFTSIPARVPARRLFDRDEEFIVVGAKRTFQSTDGIQDEFARHYTTSVRWTLRMRRAK